MSSSSAHPSPPPVRLAAAKLALLNDAEAARMQSRVAAANRESSLDTAKDMIREHPIIAAGLAAVLGFVLIRPLFLFKKIFMLLAARMIFAGIKKAL